MANLRFRIDIAMPGDKIPAALQQKPTPAQLTAMQNMTWEEIFKAIVQRVKSYGVTITNAKGGQVENAVVAKYHICRHADGLSCDAEQDL